MSHDILMREPIRFDDDEGKEKEGFAPLAKRLFDLLGSSAM